MKADTAQKLVAGYSRLTREIKALRVQIADNLDKCPGVKGDRLAVDENGWQTYMPEVDSKNREKGVHLWHWYQPEICDSGYYCETHTVWTDVGVQEAEECPHCYAAHLAIQRRKEARKELGGVKGAMTRYGSLDVPTKQGETA